MIKKIFDRTNRSKNPSQIHRRTNHIQDEDESTNGSMGSQGMNLNPISG